MKAKNVAIWVIAAIVIVGAALFLTFLASEIKPEQNQTQPQNQSEPQQQAQPQSEQPQPEPQPEPNESEQEQQQEFPLEPFTYHNLSFELEEKGAETLFKTKMAILERHGKKPEPALVAFSFRNDPRALDSIPSSLESMPSAKAYVSFGSGALSCDDSSMTALTIGYFLGLLGIDTSSAVTDPEIAASPEDVKTCADANESVTIIVLQGGSKAGVVQDGNCITATASGCKTLASVERLFLSLIDLGMAQGIIEPR